MAQPLPTALQGIRVLDLTANYAAYSGRLLADLGAEVIRVEPPGGSALRHLPTTQNVDCGNTRSFAHAFLDAGKHSVTIDLLTDAGRELFRKLVRSSDILIHTPGPSDEIDLSVEKLRTDNPRLIVASITPFGLTGPYANFVAGELTVLAAGGLLSLGGYRDSEPLAIQGEQAQLASGIFAAVAVLAALNAREERAQGVWIDVSGQECIAFALEDAVPDWYLAQRVRRRFGDVAREAGTGIYPCGDGYISIVAGRLGTAKAFTALTQWVAEAEGTGAARLLEPQWQDFAYRQSSEGIALFAEIFGAFCRSRNKEQLYHEGQARQIAIAPVNTIADLFDNAQLTANKFFCPHFDGECGKELAFPGPPYRLSRTPAEMRSGSPQLGQHNETILR
jgi:benzylsuccinate CoA-transferase BbsE subunit